MANEINGFIKVGEECEYSDYCNRSGCRCLHSGENKKMMYECGYCKSFRMIDAGRKLNNEPTILENHGKKRS
jgi:hypothetical protein